MLPCEKEKKHASGWIFDMSLNQCVQNRINLWLSTLGSCFGNIQLSMTLTRSIIFLDTALSFVLDQISSGMLCFHKLQLIKIVMNRGFKKRALQRNFIFL